MKNWNIREGQNGTGKIIGSVQANTYTGAKQKWTKIARANNEYANSYWHIHCVTEDTTNGK